MEVPMSERKSKVREVDPRPSEMFVAVNGTHIPKSMTWKQYCYYNEEGLTIQEIRFADAFTDCRDMVQAAIAADVDADVAKPWARVAINKPQVKRRIEDNLAIARRASIVGVGERKVILSKIARADITDCLTVVGNTIELDLHKAKRLGSSKGIVSIKIDEKTDTMGGTSSSKSIQMANSQSAIAELNKMDRVYDESINMSGAVVIIPAEDMKL